MDKTNFLVILERRMQATEKYLEQYKMLQERNEDLQDRVKVLSVDQKRLWRSGHVIRTSEWLKDHEGGYKNRTLVGWSGIREYSGRGGWLEIGKEKQV